MAASELMVPDFFLSPPAHVERYFQATQNIRLAESSKPHNLSEAEIREAYQVVQAESAVLKATESTRLASRRQLAAALVARIANEGVELNRTGEHFAHVQQARYTVSMNGIAHLAVVSAWRRAPLGGNREAHELLSFDKMVEREEALPLKGDTVASLYFFNGYPDLGNRVGIMGPNPRVRVQVRTTQTSIVTDYPGYNYADSPNIPDTVSSVMHLRQFVEGLPAADPIDGLS